MNVWKEFARFLRNTSRLVLLLACIKYEGYQFMLNSETYYTPSLCNMKERKPEFKNPANIISVFETLLILFNLIRNSSIFDIKCLKLLFYNKIGDVSKYCSTHRCVCSQFGKYNRKSVAQFLSIFYKIYLLLSTWNFLRI